MNPKKRTSILAYPREPKRFCTQTPPMITRHHVPKETETERLCKRIGKIEAREDVIQYLLMRIMQLEKQCVDKQERGLCSYIN
jgi:hypothetical protein